MYAPVHRICLVWRALFGSIALFLSLSTATAAADIVAIVAATSSQTVLSKNEVMDIFLGKTTRFPDGKPAQPIDQIEGSPARDEFYRTFAGKSPAQIKAYWSKIIFTGRGQPPPEVSRSTDLKKRIVEHPGAIGYIEQRNVDDSVKVVLAP